MILFSVPYTLYSWCILIVDKLKGKYKPSTPDKPTTPGPDDDSLSDNRSSVLNDEEIQGMAIRQDALIQVKKWITPIFC